jgi:hypothetical protein
MSTARRFQAELFARIRNGIMDEQDIEQQIERCRRIARMITDEHVRRTLERLAEEYASQMPPKSGDFTGGENSQRQ